MKPQTPDFEASANSLATALSEDLQNQYHDTWLTNYATFNLAYGETPVIDVDMAYIEIDNISEARFLEIESAIEALQGNVFDGFRIMAMLTDISGYGHWVEEGYLGITVSAEITNIEAIDGNELCEAFVTLGNKVHAIIEGE